LATEKLVSSLGKNLSNLKDLKYRGHGWPGKFRVTDTEGQVSEISYSDSWGSVLGKNLQWRCKICPDGCGQLADVSVGDLWESDNNGFPLFEDGEGMSVILARTIRGKQLIERAERQGIIVLMEVDLALAAKVQRYQIQRRKERGMLTGKEYVAKTIVTTDLIEDISRKNHVTYYDTLTGFKYIAGVIREKEGKEFFIGGGEESYGYLVGEFVRDKDAVLSAVVIAEMAAWASANNTSLYNMLMDIYEEYGLYHEELVSITIKGMDGVAQIKQMMTDLRSNPPAMLGGSKVIEVRDISSSKAKNLETGIERNLDLPSSNVLQFILADGSKISARPSGTEPKIKFYFSIKEKFEGKAAYRNQIMKITERIGQIRKELGV
jgi:hypothetical protein